jgi:hypothetical protein
MHPSGKKKTHPNLFTHPPNPKNTSPNILPSPIQKLISSTSWTVHPILCIKNPAIVNLSFGGCRIGLAETVNGSEWTGSDRRTHRRKSWWSPVASSASPSPTPPNPYHRQINVMNLYIGTGSDWKNLRGTAQFLSTQTNKHHVCFNI